MNRYSDSLSKARKRRKNGKLQTIFNT